MTLMMLIETRGGFDYIGANSCEWMREAGSLRRVEELTGIETMTARII
jgi:hypothetical protein